MTDWDTLQALEQLFETVNRSVGEYEEEREYNAAELVRYFDEEGGNIVSLADGDFEVRHMTAAEALDWDDPWPVTYGLDGSSTTPLIFRNGLVASASAAKIGVAGETENADIVDRTTLSGVVYLQNEEFEVGSVDFGMDGVDGDLYRFPLTDDRGDIREFRIHQVKGWLVNISNGYAEGKHARSLASELDGPLFIDGPLYPSTVFSWMLFEQEGGGPTTPAVTWPECIHDILGYYVRTIELMNDRELPIFGITKTTESDQALQALAEKLPAEEEFGSLPWKSDHQLFTDALATSTGRPDGAVISFTPWLLQSRYGNRKTGTDFVPFEGYDGISLKYADAADYQKAFFYVRTPVTHRVMRVEAPYIALTRRADRERLQRKALAEIAAQRKEPRCITQADERARINQDNRDALRQVVTATDSIVDYNERRNYDQFAHAE